MMNDFIDSNEFDFIVTVEPLISFESLDWIKSLIQIYNEFNFNLSGVCTNNKSHNLKYTDRVEWNTGLFRTMNGDGFGNGVMLTTPKDIKLVGGFKTKNYTNSFSTYCFRKGNVVVYAEEIR